MPALPPDPRPSDTVYTELTRLEPATNRRPTEFDPFGLEEPADASPEVAVPDVAVTLLETEDDDGDDEADLIALDPDGRTIVIVEVKTRTDDGIAPEANIHGVKQHRLTRLAQRLAKQERFREHPFRFDAIAVVWPRDAAAQPVIRHISGAFEAR